MEIVFRPITHTCGAPNADRIPARQPPVAAADAISVTANPAIGSPMKRTAGAYQWPQELIHRASVRVNRVKRVGALLGKSPKLFLVPKTDGNTAVDSLVQELFDAAEEEGVQVLHFSHYATIKYQFPIQEISSVMQVLRDRQGQTSIRTLIWDIDSQYTGQMMDLKRLWLKVN